MNEGRNAASDDVNIFRLAEMPALPDFAHQLDDIFFSSSATKSFASDDARSAFRQKWLGRYLDDDAEWFFVAVSGERLAGYLAGAIEDPARQTRFADIAYFADIADETAQYPAHLHVNVSESCRNLGVGSRLIDRFVQELRRNDIGGVHLVTGRNSRNIPFYVRNGFHPLKFIRGERSDSVMLGRKLG